MSDVQWYEVITAAIAIISLAISILNYYHIRRAKKAPLKIEIAKEQANHQKSPYLKIIARNTRESPITIESAGLLVHSSMFEDSELPYGINTVYFSPTSDVFSRNFPYHLPAESDLMFREPYDGISYILKQRGFSGKIKIKVVFRDATGAKHTSKVFVFDMAEAKNPTNPVNRGIL